MSCGPGIPPSKGEKGSQKFGFTIGERVEVVVGGTCFFRGWFGHVLNFGDTSVAVDLDEPPVGQTQNGQWFLPKHLRPAPQK